MSENNNKVTVKIYGQEYTISGEQSREHIIKVADHVDDVMKIIGYSLPEIPTTKLAILSAINITDEFFALKNSYSSIVAEKDELEKDKDHYVQLWEEAKKSFLQYKDDAKTAMAQKEEIQAALNTKSNELNEVKEAGAKKDETIDLLNQKIAGLTDRLKTTEEGKTTSSETIRDLEDKYKEIEGNYFELQMENIRLKGDLEHYKKIVD
jgi:cell division protein ZapA